MEQVLQETPNRIVVHVDLDCFYCQVEQKRLGIPRSKPCAVQQWQGLIAVNYAARAAGVTRHMRVQEAMSTCPTLQCVHVEVLDENGSIDESAIPAGQAVGTQPDSAASRRGKACLERYRRASAEIFAIFKRMFPRSILEKASIDEAYFDITDAVSVKIDEQSQSRSLSWQQMVEEATECSVIIGGSLMSDQEFDGRLAIAARLTADLRGQVERELDYTVSAGISHNKILSKLASAMNKPNNQTVIPVHAVSLVMESLPLKKVRNFGGAVGQKLEALGCSTAADVQALSLSTLEQNFGSSAGWVARAARGISDEPVKPKSVPKSMLAAKSFGASSDWQVLQHWLKVLCSELASRMQEDSNIHSRRPKNLVVHYRSSGTGGRFGAGQERSRSVHLPTSELPSASELVAAALKLLRSSPDVLPCNRLAVSTNVFVNMSSKAGSLSSIFSPKSKLQNGKGAGCTRSPSQASGVKRAKLTHDASPSAPASCQPPAPRGPTIPAVTPGDASTAIHGIASHRPPARRSLLQLVQLQGKAPETDSICETPLKDSASGRAEVNGADTECHLWIARAAKGNAASTDAGDGACEHAYRPDSQQGFDGGRAGPQSRSTGFQSPAQGSMTVQQRWQAGSSCHASEADAPQQCCGPGDREARRVVAVDPAREGSDTLNVHKKAISGAAKHGAGTRAAECAGVSDDHHEGIDVAEQRRIYHLIQMQAREHRQGGSLASASMPHRAAKPAARHANKPANKQASIMSLLNKK